MGSWWLIGGHTCEFIVSLKLGRMKSSLSGARRVRLLSQIQGGRRKEQRAPGPAAMKYYVF